MSFVEPNWAGRAALPVAATLTASFLAEDCCTVEPHHDAMEKLAKDFKTQATDGCDIECGPHDEHDHGDEKKTASAAGLRAGPLAFLVAAGMAMAAAF